MSSLMSATTSTMVTYDYLDEQRTLLYQVCRTIPKDFRQRRPDGVGWKWSIAGVRRVLYRLPDLIASSPATVFVCEGEKDCDALVKLGLIATTNSGGAGKWRDEYTESLRGRDVVILPDNDRPGQEHAEGVAKALLGVASTIKVLKLPGLPDKGDVSDWLAAGGTAQQLVELVNTSSEWSPILPTVSEPESPAECPAADPGAIPDRLLHVPGFIDDVMQWTLRTAPYPQRVLAFGGALSLQGHLGSRKVCDQGDSRTSLYVLGLANSGAGKDWPRKINQQILLDAGLAGNLGDAIASGEGLEDALYVRPSMLFQLDEMDGLIGAIKQGKDARFEGIMGVMLKMYTNAGSLYSMRVRAGREQALIDQPGLTIYGTAIPQQFYQAMSAKMLTNGLFSRLLVLEAGKRGLGQDARRLDLPSSITSVAKWWKDFTPGNGDADLLGMHPRPQVVEYSTAAASVLNDFRTDADRAYREAEAQSDLPGMAIWTRANEKARRLALNYACSVDHKNPQIDEAAAIWAGDFVRHQTKRMLFMAESHVSENAFDANCKRFLDVLRDWKAKKGTAPMPHWMICRKLKGWTPRDVDDVRKMLSEQGLIDFKTVVGGGRPGEVYRLL